MRLSDALELWADWMKHDNPKLGFPKKAMLAPNATGWRFATSEERDHEYNKIVVVAVDASVNSLILPERDAIYRCYCGLGAVARFKRTYEDRLEAARQSMRKMLAKRCVVIQPDETISIVSGHIKTMAAVPVEDMPLAAKAILMKAEGRSYQQIGEELKITKIGAIRAVNDYAKLMYDMSNRQLASVLNVTQWKARQIKKAFSSRDSGRRGCPEIVTTSHSSCVGGTELTEKQKNVQ